MKFNHTARFLLFSSPYLMVGFLLQLFHPDSAYGVETNTINTTTIQGENNPSVNLDCHRTDCQGNNYLASFPTVNQNSNINEFPNVNQDDQGHLLLNVSEEESDTAVKMFGCDCVKAINALRQARGIPIGVEGDRILPGPLIRPCTQTLPSA